MTPRRDRFSRRARAALSAGALVLAATGVTGCGDREAPGQRDAGLETALVNVETALAAGKPARARTPLQSIVAQARAGKADGTLSAAEADAIIAAATELLARIPKPAVTPAPSAEPPPPENDRGDGGKKKKHEKKGDDEDRDD